MHSCEPDRFKPIRADSRNFARDNLELVRRIRAHAWRARGGFIIAKFKELYCVLSVP